MPDLFLLRLDLVGVTRQRQQSLPLDVPAYLVTRRRMVMIMIAVMMMAMMIVLMIVKAMMIRSSSCLCSRAPGALLSPARPPVRQHRYSACIKSYIITIFCLALRIILSCQISLLTCCLMSETRQLGNLSMFPRFLKRGTMTSSENWQKCSATKTSSVFKSNIFLKLEKVCQCSTRPAFPNLPRALG